MVAAPALNRNRRGAARKGMAELASMSARSTGSCRQKRGDPQGRASRPASPSRAPATQAAMRRPSPATRMEGHQKGEAASVRMPASETSQFQAAPGGSYHGDKGSRRIAVASRPIVA